jgi:hypothetical protein
MSLSETQDQAILPLSQDAALVAALAGTAVAFAHSREDEAERWLRALRLHGRTGHALQALGVGESALTDSHEDLGDGPPAEEGDLVSRVVGRAEELATERHADRVGTIDLLEAVFDVYDPLMERALSQRGSSREELRERLEETPPED